MNREQQHGFALAHLLKLLARGRVYVRTMEADRLLKEWRKVKKIQLAVEGKLIYFVKLSFN